VPRNRGADPPAGDQIPGRSGDPGSAPGERVLAGQIDVGVTCFMRGQQPQKLLSGVPVGGPGRSGALVPDDHPLARRGSVHVSELAGSPMGFLARESNPDFFDAMMAALAADGFTPLLRPQPAGPFSQNIIQSNMIAQRPDGGWSLAADFLTRHPPAGVAGLPFEGLPHVRTQMWAIWRATLGKTVQEHLREVYRKIAPGFDLDRESDPGSIGELVRESDHAGCATGRAERATPAAMPEVADRSVRPNARSPIGR
jgi:hypothetical protein